jgi:hypothetical protein
VEFDGDGSVIVICRLVIGSEGHGLAEWQFAVVMAWLIWLRVYDGGDLIGFCLQVVVRDGGINLMKVRRIG